jgi:FkbH-like protein
MDAADFLFPRDLEVTKVQFRKVLVVGSCLAETFVIRFRQAQPDTVFDFVLYNNAVELPARSREDLGGYDLQYVQLPLRSILTDRAIRIADDGASVDFLAIGKANIDAMIDKALRYNRDAGLLTFVANFIVPQSYAAPSLAEAGTSTDLVAVVRALNVYLAERIRGRANVFLADLDSLASSLGKRFFLDDSVGFTTHGSVLYDDWHHHEVTPYWTAPGPGRIEPIPDIGVTYESRYAEYFRTVYRQIEALYRVVNQVDMVKLVVFDLDNTLWRGQLVEHYQPGQRWPYSDGWPLGIWDAIQHLRRRGILVSIASKNDHHLVESKWHDAVEPPFIKFSDFVAPQISWEPKAETLGRLLRDFNLTAKSVVFVDDNPVERESVQLAHPGIRTLGVDPFIIRRVLLWASETQVPLRTSESAKREAMMKQQVVREAERRSLSREEFLAGLDLRVDLSRIDDAQHPSFSRVFELVNKTNQFNTTGVRWTFEEYDRHFAAGGHVYAFSVRDRFTDYGTVGAILCAGATIVQFVMSCRVIGLEVEIAALRRVAERARALVGAAALRTRLVETEANTPCRDVFDRAGFHHAGAGSYELAASVELAPLAHVSFDGG